MASIVRSVSRRVIKNVIVCSAPSDLTYAHLYIHGVYGVISTYQILSIFMEGAVVGLPFRSLAFLSQVLCVVGLDFLLCFHHV